MNTKIVSYILLCCGVGGVFMTSFKNKALPDNATQFNTINSIHSLYEKQAEEFKSEIADLKKTITIKNDPFTAEEKQKNPYSISDDTLIQLVENLPKDTENKKYHIDIHKNNETGNITLTVYGRFMFLDKTGLYYDYQTYTYLITQKIFSGFKIISEEQIISERTLRIFVHSKVWAKDSDTPTFQQYTSENTQNNTFWSVGTGFVLDKEVGKPVYYIATNKHVFMLDEEPSPHSYNIKMIETHKSETSKYISIFDSVINEEKSPYFNPDKNLKGMITFGSSYLPNGGKNIHFANEKLTMIEKNDSTISEIKIMNDFSKTVTVSKKTGTTKSTFSSKNRNFDKLSSINEKNVLGQSDPTHKSSIDLVIVRVTFKDDPFKSWWTQRPTNIRSLKDSDLFQFNSYWKDEGVATKQTQRPSSPYNTHTQINSRVNKNNPERIMELGEVNIKNEFITAGFPILNNAENNHRNRNYQLQIKRGLVKNYICHDSRKYGNYSYCGSMTYPEGIHINLNGSSGSAIWDKNFNVVGILYAGRTKKIKHIKHADSSKNGATNEFFWLEIDLTKDYLSQNNQENDSFRIPPYKYITNLNSYSLHSTIKEKYPNTKTHLMG